ncbi:hypothetical protein NRI_0804 [Neorickettsia risticii str. Illinois]|uniref:Uncharacterized protein n=1 Tax=Neorickettsia risticii (strain Illinois) TaxID=434131 RepID=C6V5V5_NEORI|nr:hypothetical protein NRI_0804 [Neorickettsia risticii str. Illinois]
MGSFFIIEETQSFQESIFLYLKIRTINNSNVQERIRGTEQSSIALCSSMNCRN